MDLTRSPRPSVASPGVKLTAIDIPERMVELARSRGVDAQLGDVQDLPFDDAVLEVVIAAWMLYHVPDLAKR